METITIEEGALVKEISAITSTNHGLSIVCDGDYAFAAEALKELKGKEKLVSEFFLPIVKAAHQVHKAAKARENEMLKPLMEARKYIGAEMGRYQHKAEEERKRELEIVRVAEQKIADEGAEEYAQNLDAQGLPDLANAARNNVPAVQPKVEKLAPKVAGTRVARSWKYEVTDPSAVPREYLCVDERAIAAIVRVRKDSTSIPGVRVYSTTNVT